MADPAPNHYRLSRRALLLGAGVGFAGLLAACTGPDELVEPQPTRTSAQPTPTSRPAARDATSTATIEPGREDQQAGPTTPAGPDATPPDGASQATATSTREPTEVEIDYVPVVSRRLQIRNISLDRLHAVWNGEVTDWADLGEPGSHIIKRVTVEGSSGPLDPAKADLNIASLDDLEEFLHFETGTIALLPKQRIDFKYRHLKVDDVDYLVSDGSGNPLRQKMIIDPRDSGLFDLSADQQSLPQPVSMTWVGDIIFGRYVHAAMERVGDFSAPFRDVHHELTWADLTIGNLECSISENIVPPVNRDTFSFSTYPAAVEGLKLAQIDVLSRANNHTMDFGIQGMNDTAAALDAAGIKHFGIGENLDAARKAVVVELNGVSYAFIGYNGVTDHWDGAGPDWAGTMPMEPDYVIQDIERELAAGHVVIPYFHWGVEYVADPTEEQRYFAHLAIDHGAALVMGSHPHWVQAVETYQGKAIVYSLGNFIFDQAWSIETQQGMIAHVWMQGSQVLSIDLVPVFIEQEHRPRIMDPWEANPVLNRIWQATDNILIHGQAARASSKLT